MASAGKQDDERMSGDGEEKTMDTEQAKFEGWAIVEMMGHQREIGYVTTEYFGGAALFRIDSPEIPEREFELLRPEYLDAGSENECRVFPAGTKIKRSAIPSKSRLVSPGALYALNPCTEETARHAIEKAVPRKVILLHVPEEKKPAMLPGETADTFGQDVCEGCGKVVDDCNCPVF